MTHKLRTSIRPELNERGRQIKISVHPAYRVADPIRPSGRMQQPADQLALDETEAAQLRLSMVLSLMSVLRMPTNNAPISESPITDLMGLKEIIPQETGRAHRPSPKRVAAHWSAFRPSFGWRLKCWLIPRSHRQT